MSIDPVTTDANTGGTFNRYVYANNNPYKYTDPDGRFSEVACADMGGNCTTYGGSNGKSNSSEVSTSAKVGAVVGGLAGGAAAAGCDVYTVGACAGANPAIVVGGVAGGAAAGAAAGAILSSGSALLAKNIALATNAVKQQFEASHHIVAENDPRAAVSRGILGNANMDINSAFNGMNMSSMYHSRLHTQTDHAAVTSALTGAGNFGEVAIRLTAIRIQINMGTFPF